VQKSEIEVPGALPEGSLVDATRSVQVGALEVSDVDD
jgi:hypothetical protein